MIKAWTAFWAGRKRRQEKSRRAQERESSFPERLASRRTSRKTNSKIDLGFTSQPTRNSDLGFTSQPTLNSDLGFTSQPTLNSDLGFTSQPNLNSDRLDFTSQPNLNPDSENEKRRPTFSKFLQLWKGLRNSKRKSNSEETRRSVVFTIPTEDIFPKSEPTQQTQRVLPSKNHDHVIHMEGFVTHLCDVHRVNEDDNYDKYDVHHLSDQNLNTKSEQPDKHDIKEETIIKENCKMTAETKRNQNQLCSISSNHILEQVKHAGNLRPKIVRVVGKNGRLDDDISKESDDVENDSGCGSSCHEIACPESSIGYVALNVKSLDHNSCLGQCHHSTLQTTYNNNNQATEHYISNDERSQQQLLKECRQTEEDSFEALIQLAKLGMSSYAQQEVFKHLETTTGDNLNAFNENQVTKNFDHDIQTDETLEIDPRTAGAKCTSMVFTTNTAHQVDSGVKLASTNSLLINDNDRKNEALLSGLTKQTADDKKCEGFASSAGTIPTIQANDHETNFCKNKTGGFHSKQFQGRKQVSFESTRTSAAEHSHSCLGMMFNETSGSFQESSRAVTESKHTSPVSGKTLPSRRAKNESQKITEAKEMINSEKTSAKNLYNLKVPSFESLHLPSHTSEDQDKRIRSFSATIRRKFSFRDRQSSDDTSVVPSSAEQDVLKSKKIKAFRSFRVHKKNKASSLDAQSERCLASGDTKGYQSIFDKILSEDTGSAVFSDVPFTIPEICD